MTYLSDSEFKKLIRKQHNYIKQIAKRDFIRNGGLHKVL